MAVRSQDTKRIIHLSMFSAIALTIFILEAQLPPPVFYIPGMKLGLANIVTLYLLANYSGKDAFAVLMVRIFLGSFFAGQMLSLIYSLAGGLLSFCAMSLCIKLLGKNSLWFTGIVGGVCHNIAQISIAAIVMKTTSVFTYIPLLIISGIGAGIFCGLTANFLLKHIQRIKNKTKSKKKS